MGLPGLFLAVVGVYSVVSYAAVQRTHEIWIRMALGAAPQDILRMVLRQSVAVVGAGLTAGLAVALAGTRAIASFIVGVRPTDATTFVTVVVLLAVMALVACWVPARRATRFTIGGAALRISVVAALAPTFSNSFLWCASGLSEHSGNRLTRQELELFRA
jgi:ABC-type antimicrobial peptide transport system permease subunit